MNQRIAAYGYLVWSCLAVGGCAVGVSTVNGGDEDGGSGAKENSGSQSYGENGDAAAPGTDAGGKKDAGAKMPAVDSGATPAAGCASPATPADCTCASGHTCAANNCYGGYLCDTSLNKCKAPTACP